MTSLDGKIFTQKKKEKKKRHQSVQMGSSLQLLATFIASLYIRSGKKEPRQIIYIRK